MTYRQITYRQMTDKEFLEVFYQKLLAAPNNPLYCTFIEIERLRLIIDNMPDKENLLESTLKHIDKLCEERNVKFAEESSYKIDELLFSPSIKASSV